MLPGGVLTPSWGEVTLKAEGPGQGRRQEQNCGALGTGTNGVTYGEGRDGKRVFQTECKLLASFPTRARARLFNPP